MQTNCSVVNPACCETEFPQNGAELKTALGNITGNSLLPVVIKLESGVEYKLSSQVLIRNSVRPIIIEPEDVLGKRPVISGCVEAQSVWDSEGFAKINHSQIGSSITTKIVHNLTARNPNNKEVKALFVNYGSYNTYLNHSARPVGIVLDKGVYLNQINKVGSMYRYYCEISINAESPDNEGKKFGGIFGCLRVDSFLYIYAKWQAYRLRVVELEELTDKEKEEKEKLNRKGCIVETVDELSGVILNGDVCKVALANFTSSKGGIYLFNNISDRQIEFYGVSEAGTYKVGNIETFLNIQNSANVTIRGVSFQCNGIACLNGKWGGQAESTINTVVRIEKSCNIRIEDCEFTDLYGYCVGIDCDGDKGNVEQISSSKITLRNNYIHDIYGGAFHVSGDSSHHRIDNNRIENYGRYQPGAVGILIRHSHTNDIVHNTICEGYYTGISLGWIWGYAEIRCYDNYVAYNHIHHCLQSTLNDGGGIYLLGQQPGTVIECNLIHNINSFKVLDAAGLYLDEGSSYLNIQRNVIFETNIGLHLHYGFGNEVFYNLFANNSDCSMKISREEKHLQCSIHNNIFQSDDAPLLHSVMGTVNIFKNLVKDSPSALMIRKAVKKGILRDTHYGDIELVKGGNNDAPIISYRKSCYVGGFYIGNEVPEIGKQGKRDFPELVLPVGGSDYPYGASLNV